MHPTEAIYERLTAAGSSFETIDDEVLGQEMKAFRRDAGRDGDPRVADEVGFVQARRLRGPEPLANAVRPLPRNASGKVMKPVLLPVAESPLVEEWESPMAIGNSRRMRPSAATDCPGSRRPRTDGRSTRARRPLHNGSSYEETR